MQVCINLAHGVRSETAGLRFLTDKVESPARTHLEDEPNYTWFQHPAHLSFASTRAPIRKHLAAA